MTKQELLDNAVDVDGDINWDVLRTYDREHGLFAAKKVIHDSLAFDRLAHFSLGDDPADGTGVFFL